MDFNKVYLLSLTPDSLENYNNLPVEINLTSLTKKESYNKIVKNNIEKWASNNESIRNISFEKMRKEGLSPKDIIVYLNLFCVENDITKLFTPDYENDSKLLLNIEKKSEVPIKFILVDFYSGINPYQKTFWQHLYNKEMHNNLMFNNSAMDKNKIYKKNFNKILKIHEINKS